MGFINQAATPVGKNGPGQKWACTQISDSAAGKRLDEVLGSLVPEVGRRHRQYLIRIGAVTVDGRRQPKGYRVASGQEVCIWNLSAEEGLGSEPMQAVAVVRATNDFAAVFKPGEVHTQNQATSPHPSLEQALPGLFPGQNPVLLNRLDQSTSGLVLVGLHFQAALAYKQMQEEGQTAKTYLALVHGRLVEEKCVRNFLQTAKRRKVRVLNSLEPDPLRWTTIRPVGYMPGDQASLVQAGIYKGRRHQIRAHLAACGHPVRGDALYGPDHQGGLFLHHWKISFPGFTAQADPDWDIDFRHFLFQGGL